MQIQQIQAFILLCQIKNMSKCSKELHISQQGLSRQIKAMEDELNTSLFIRTHQGVKPTEQARQMYPYLKECMNQYTQALNQIQTKKQELKIAICPGIKQYFGLDFFQDFQSQNPNIQLKLEFLSDIDCENTLYQDQCDAAFLDWPEHKESYHSIKIVESPLVAVMRKDNALANKEQISMHDLEGKHIYIPDQSHRMSQRFMKHWPKFYDSVITDFTSNEYEDFYKELPKSGKGIALTFEFLCKNLDQNLIAIPIQEQSYVKLYYCTKKDHTQSAALDTFTEYINTKK